MKILLPILFCIAGAVNVISCAANRQLPRQISKALLMPLLGVVYWLSARALEPWAVAALALGWAGDLFLIRPGRELPRTVGIGAFLAGHLCYLLAMFRHFSIAPNLWACIVVPGVFLLAAALLYLRLFPLLPKNMRVTGAGYFLVLAAVGAVGGLAALSGCAGGPFLLLGGVLFLVSDTILCVQFFTVGDPAPKFDFAVMLTYILAQAMLILGFCV